MFRLKADVENKCSLPILGEETKQLWQMRLFCISLDPLEVENCELEILQILTERESNLEEISLRSSYSHGITMQAMQNLVNTEKIKKK